MSTSYQTWTKLWTFYTVNVRPYKSLNFEIKYCECFYYLQVKYETQLTRKENGCKIQGSVHPLKQDTQYAKQYSVAFHIFTTFNNQGGCLANSDDIFWLYSFNFFEKAANWPADNCYFCGSSFQNNNDLLIKPKQTKCM